MEIGRLKKVSIGGCGMRHYSSAISFIDLSNHTMWPFYSDSPDTQSESCSSIGHTIDELATCHGDLKLKAHDVNTSNHRCGPSIQHQTLMFHLPSLTCLPQTCGRICPYHGRLIPPLQDLFSKKPYYTGTIRAKPPNYSYVCHANLIFVDLVLHEQMNLYIVP